MEQQPFDENQDETTVVPGQRNAGRDSLLLTARMKLDGRPECQVRVRNLSEGGLMAEYPQPVGIGTSVLMEIRGIGWVRGMVAWATEGRLGIAFETKVDPLSARKPVGGRGQTAPKPKPKPLLPRD
jgi:hypothetical protein